MARRTIPSRRAAGDRAGRGPARLGRPTQRIRRYRFAVIPAALLIAGLASAEEPSAGGERLAAVSETDSAAVADLAVPPEQIPCFRGPPEWRTPEEFLLGEPMTALGVFGLLVDASIEGRMASAARSSLRGWLGLDDVVLDRGGIRFRKDYGERLTIRTTTGLGAAAEDALRADYRLWRSWHLRSEARERGETTMELRREYRFW